MRNRQITIDTKTMPPATENRPANDAKEKTQSFADVLGEKLGKKNELQFSEHALRRISSRSIDVMENDKLERLNKAVEIAAGKGSEDALVLVDEAAFIVSVKNNKVITTLSKEDMLGNIFTNIDSTVII
jgi:flagellar operon protein